MENWGEGKVWAAGWSSSGRFDVNAVVGCASRINGVRCLR
jgi:hypothetical protein